MSAPDPLDQLLRAAELRKELEGLAADQIELRLSQHEDLRELVEPLLAPSAAADGEPLDRVIGDFRLVREIGRGGMGIVYEAWQISLHRQVALKLLSPALGQDPASIARFHREATLAAGLSHPSLASVHGFVVDPQAHCLVMEYVDGVPCDELLRSMHARPAGERMAAVGDLGVATAEHDPSVFAAGIVADVAEALHHAHGAGVIHRDVKPGNIIVRADGRAVLTDFGLAREAGRQGVTMTGELTGTPAYQSPEQVGLASVDLGPLTDVFSLGVTLYELLSGHKPFDGDSVASIQQKILRAKPVDLRRIDASIPRDLARIVEKATHKHPSDRYASAGAMAEDLRRFLGASEVHARPLPPLLRTRRWCAQNPLLAAFFALLAAGSVAVGLQWWRAEGFLQDYRSLAAGVRVKALRQATENAPPAWPEHESEYRGWVEEARVLQGWLPEFEERVERLRRDAREGDDGSLEFPSVEQQFVYEGNARNLEELRDVAARVLPALTEQLEWSRTIRARTVDDYARAWQIAADAVAADPRFGGFELAPQVGLVPLRRDPTSGLWEFAHLRSGAMPAEGPNGRWIITGDTAVVFVLVPGGTFWMGAQSVDPEARNFDPNARDRDGPVHEVRVERPFFLSKFELSRGQWRRLGGELHVADALDTQDDEDLARYPLIGQSYDDVVHRLARFGLLLPSESQWEMCCRAGGEGRWSCGDDEAELVRIANIRDDDLSRARERYRPPTGYPFSEHSDGFAGQAPVGAFRFAPNRWGLFQMHGNVDELCRDCLGTKSYDEAAPEPLEGLRPTVSTARVVRGGCYIRNVAKTGCGIRNGVPAGARIRAIGVRPMRRVLE